MQDDWRLFDNLTVNLGVRWEWTQQAFNLLHDLTVKQQTGPNPFWDPSLPLSLTTVSSLPEDLFTTLFAQVFGLEKTQLLVPQLPVQDTSITRRRHVKLKASRVIPSSGGQQTLRCWHQPFECSLCRDDNILPLCNTIQKLLY